MRDYLFPLLLALLSMLHNQLLHDLPAPVPEPTPLHAAQ